MSAECVFVMGKARAPPQGSSGASAPVLLKLARAAAENGARRQKGFSFRARGCL